MSVATVKKEAPSFRKTLSEVVGRGEDYEWYPTTDEIIDALVSDLKVRPGPNSFMDIGAGNGKVLEAAREKAGMHTLHAIEKSRRLLAEISRDVLIAGVDFFNTTLIDKEVDCIFCNPPFSEFEKWAVKILEEAQPGTRLYLVLPRRWKSSKEITEALELRKTHLTVLGTFSFQDSEHRKARVSADLLLCKLPQPEFRKNDYDPFEEFFNRTFDYPKPEELKAEEEEEDFGLIRGENVIESLVASYEQRQNKLFQNFQAVCRLDPGLLQEFELTKASLIHVLREKFSGLKKRYWVRLLKEVNSVKERLTAASTKEIFDRLNRHTGIEFNRDNAYAVIQWVVVNANDYFDRQLVETYEKLVGFANVEPYVSNQRVFTRDQFSYWAVRDKKTPDNYRLKVGHRIVLENSGGLRKSDFSFENGLTERAAELLCDLLVVARNLGFRRVQPGPVRGAWNDNGERVFACADPNDGNEEVSLVAVRAFYNGNLHLRLLPEFVHAMNARHGILKGWIRDEKEAVEEAGVPPELAEKYCRKSFRLETTKLLPGLPG